MVANSQLKRGDEPFANRSPGRVKHTLVRARKLVCGRRWCAPANGDAHMWRACKRE